ncbi:MULTISPECIES: UDP-2,4-diacetamido-2,4,6-trideoxy-beta-L-altropyranose hydrolase [Vibrio]|uniref:UDP-2,4-diacetamido-2,4, 6-trideoxy-beta-L-altropyranose hydrolase n=1 Tax=Vibrio TaxID=662 RepID=UPI00023763A7|nr:MULTISPECIES: UDP-2,4-diacetamido-2,4,6-trideoxy-beta-L-altropyranose hydrolase [Vibrio]MDK9775069.1 UDP-2,4-diacetamido-2,4,6-trideoxy-beta-L-altropyranose hydrolase [Vibrio sp. D401a]MDK9807735.1 UDP-2,4-diacetamido-2,4,6-trideoxy-beta-L-altropyranose hydrolase [Vibrio sp. D406a]USD50178.1 UDP-2,4-diacetamido-2,4,6-trideoxy-beta-L-altropyranose hydrolase [Vibrio sp. SCSIO 43153]
MLVGIRVDASLKMGTGHTFRMLTLASRLKQKGHEIVFISRRLKGNLIALVKEKHSVIELPEPDVDFVPSTHCGHAAWLEVSYDQEITQTRDALTSYLKSKGRSQLDWLVIDHYAIEKDFQLALKPHSKDILQIDDLADRQHICDVLLDQNFYRSGEARYDGLLPTESLRLCGPRYALLREEFAVSRRNLPAYQSRLMQKKVVLFFGGVDIANETEKALKGLLSVDSDDSFDVIIGMNNPHREALTALCKKHLDRVTLHIQVENMMDFFSSAYLYIGAVGATTWERCVLALPGIVCSVADNQKDLAINLHQIGGHHYLGLNTDLTSSDYANAYKLFSSEPALLHTQSKLCAELIDGKGCERVVKQLEEISRNDYI